MAKKNVKETAQKDYPDFVDSVDKLSVAELEKRMLGYAKESENVRTALEENTAINNMKEQLKEAKGPFNDTQKALRVKIRYIMQLIGEKGGNT